MIVYTNEEICVDIWDESDVSPADLVYSQTSDGELTITGGYTTVLTNSSVSFLTLTLDRFPSGTTTELIAGEGGGVDGNTLYASFGLDNSRIYTVRIRMQDGRVYDRTVRIIRDE